MPSCVLTHTRRHTRALSISRMSTDSVFTVSLSDRGLNDLKGEVYGGYTPGGISEDTLMEAVARWKCTGRFGGDVQVYHLNHEACHQMRLEEEVLISNGAGTLPRAKIVVIRNFASHVLGASSVQETFDTLCGMHYDAKCKSNYGKKLVNQLARHTTMLFPGRDVVVTDEERMHGRASVNDLDLLPLVQRTVELMQQEFGITLPVAEVNHYYDPSKCGLGWHGDAERNVNMILRMGARSVEMPLNIQWFYNQSPYGAVMQVPLQQGDLLLFSHKALGTDFKTPPLARPTLRHAVGVNARPKPTKEQKEARRKPKKRARDPADASG